MKRIVLRHTYGPLEGLLQILGLYPADQPILSSICDTWGEAVLEHIEPRYVLYRTQPLSPLRPAA